MRSIGSYRSSHVQSAPNHVVVALLLAEAVRRINRARSAVPTSRAFTDDLGHARAIIVELRNALDPTAAPQLVARLTALYDFTFHELIAAGKSRSVERLAACENVLMRLTEAWQQLNPAEEVA